MGRECAAVRSQFPDRGEREYLESAAVRKYRPVPRYELVQAAGSFQNVQSRSEVEVISVPEYDFCPYILFQIPVVYALDRTYGTHGHEDRSFYLSVVRGDDAASGIRSRVCRCLFEFHFLFPQCGSRQ